MLEAALFHRIARKYMIKPCFVVICTYARRSVYYSLMHWPIFKEVRAAVLGIRDCDLYCNVLVFDIYYIAKGCLF